MQTRLATRGLRPSPEPSPEGRWRSCRWLPTALSSGPDTLHSPDPDVLCDVCNTQELWLNWNQIGDAGMAAFAQAMKPVSEGGSGAMAQCTHLSLHDNKIGDVGMQAFASAAVSSGAMAQLTHLYLGLNQIGDVGVSALASACAGGALANCQTLRLGGNQIGDIGMAAFAQAITPVSEGGSGAMALKNLYINDNPCSDAAKERLKAACKPRGITGSCGWR